MPKLTMEEATHIATATQASASLLVKNLIRACLNDQKGSEYKAAILASSILGTAAVILERGLAPRLTREEFLTTAGDVWDALAPVFDQSKELEGLVMGKGGDA
jgi:hypothetical protein